MRSLEIIWAVVHATYRISGHVERLSRYLLGRADVLRCWQDAGLFLEKMQIESPGERGQFQVSRPSWYRAMFQRALASLGLRRAPDGGFGAWMPDSSASG